MHRRSRSPNRFTLSLIQILLIAFIATAAQSAFAKERNGPPGGQDNNQRWPSFKVDPGWPKPLPNHWIVGQVGGVAVDRNNHIWIVQRPLTLTNDEAWATEAIAYRCEDGTVVQTSGACSGGDPVPIDGLGNARPDGPQAECCAPAPSVMKFNRAGDLLAAWGGPSDPGFLGPHGAGQPGCDPGEGCQWPAGEHGIYVDDDGYVYLAGNGFGAGSCGGNACPWAASHGWDAMVLKFSSNGTFIYQIGDPNPAVAPNSNDTAGAANGTPQPYRPADMEVDHETNELYIADGYGNHRVLVVDASTGLYTRHFGAYGSNPVDDNGDDPIGADPNFKNPVHCVRIVGDLLYVCDRINNRIQVFNKNKVGAPCSNPGKEVGKCGFLGEVFLAGDTLGNGSTWDVDTSSDHYQTCIYNPDGTNQKVWILNRRTLAVLDTFGNGGRGAGQFHWIHNLAVDGLGNIYTAEVDTGKRAQKFIRTGPWGCYSGKSG